MCFNSVTSKMQPLCVKMNKEFHLDEMIESPLRDHPETIYVGGRVGVPCDVPRIRREFFC